jgi:tight adherence protein B
MASNLPQRGLQVMILIFISIIVSLATAGCVYVTALALPYEDNTIRLRFSQYCNYWSSLIKYRGTRKQAIENELDTFLTALADALVTVPNLTEALNTTAPHLTEPIKTEIEIVLGEVRLGRSIEDSLESLCTRLQISGLDAAIGATLLGRRTGGNMAVTLRRIAGTLREMARLKGVIRSKTAEGRSQAWVMGMVPPVLIATIEKIDPNWLAPLWNDPIGWILLGAAALLEAIAIVLIRRIVAVKI